MITSTEYVVWASTLPTQDQLASLKMYPPKILSRFIDVVRGAMKTGEIPLMKGITLQRQIEKVIAVKGKLNA